MRVGGTPRYKKRRKFGDTRGDWLTNNGDPMGFLSIFIENSIYDDPKYLNPEFDILIGKASYSDGAEHFKYYL